jgi:hypothetical protein
MLPAYESHLLTSHPIIRLGIYYLQVSLTVFRFTADAACHGYSSFDAPGSLGGVRDTGDLLIVARQRNAAGTSDFHGQLLTNEGHVSPEASHERGAVDRQTGHPVVSRQRSSSKSKLPHRRRSRDCRPIASRTPWLPMHVKHPISPASLQPEMLSLLP